MAEAVGPKGQSLAGSRRLALGLNVVVFLAGAGSLATEIGAARLLAPY